MVVISQSGLLFQVSSFTLPSGQSGPVLTLSNATRTSLPSPHLLVVNAGVCAASLLGSYLWARNLWVLIMYLFSLPVMLPSVVPRLARDSAVRVFPGVWKLFFKTPFLGWSSIPTSFVSLFNLLYFFLLPFEDNGLLFWVPNVLCRHSQVVLWNFLSVQMFF